MKKLAFSAVAGAFVLVACSHREPTDAQLAALLKADRITRVDLADPSPPFDTTLIGCLRAWSGDAVLMKGLPAALNNEEGRKVCRKRVEARITDLSHNPGKFTFTEISAPKVVQRSIALAGARRISMINSASALPPPAALGKPSQPPVPPQPKAPPPPSGPPIEMGAAGEALKDAEQLCQQAQQKAATSDDPNVKNFGALCGTAMQRTRAGMEAAAANGDSAKLEGYAKTVSKSAQYARTMLESGEKK